MLPSQRQPRSKATLPTEVEVIDLTGTTPHSLTKANKDYGTSATNTNSHSNLERTHSTIKIEDDDDDDLHLFRELTPRELRDVERMRTRRDGSSGHKVLQSARGGLEHIVVKAQMGVQLLPNEAGRVYFFWIKKILRDSKGEVYLRGILLKRHGDVYPGTSTLSGQALHAILPLHINELCMHLNYTPDKLASPLHEECLSEVPLSDVHCERKIVFTNQEHPAFNYQNQGHDSMSTYGTKEGRVEVLDKGSLTCRWKYAEVIKNNKAMPKQILNLEKVECDEGKGIPDSVQLEDYGRPTNRPPIMELRITPTLQSRFVDLTIKEPAKSKKRKSGVQETSYEEARTGTTKRRSPSVLFERITPALHSKSSSPTQPMSTRTEKQSTRYTYGDICAGGGGTFRAAEMAGLRIDWAVDNWNVAVDTLCANFPGQRIMPESIEEFVERVKHDKSFRVDVIHISFPCQPHSHANQGQNEEQDAKNAATISALEHILQHLRPRIVTLEQTDHILTKNEGWWYRKMVAQLTAAKYNVLCDRFNMAEYGVPSFRKRLIIVASCPGQELPILPQPTHGPGLKPFVTAGESIRGIPEDDELHNVEERQLDYEKKPSNLEMADLDVPLKRIIMTGGAQVLLRGADGRKYKPTNRQQMRWSTFPDHHTLCGSTKKDFTKQIGNAVPPRFMKQIFKQVIKALHNSDRKVAEWNAETVEID